MSVSSAEAQGDGDSVADGWGNYVSGDGRYVVFESDATNLVPGDTNGVRDVFLRDRWLTTTERISVSTGGVEGNGVSGGASVSANGWIVVFRSHADNLVAGDTNAAEDIFLRDRLAGTTTRIEVGGNSSTPNISDDGRYVVWACCYSTPDFEIFLHDRQTSVTTQVTNGNRSSSRPRLSGDGRYIVFDSWASNLGPVDEGGADFDIYLYDQQTQQLELISKNEEGEQSLQVDSHPDISADGRFIVFATESTIFDPDDFNGRDLVLIDRQAGTVEQLTVTASASHQRISDDGALALFDSSDCDSVTGDTNGFSDVFLHNIDDPGPAQIDSDCDGVPDVPGLAPILATTLVVDPVESMELTWNRGSPLAVNPDTNLAYVVSEPEDKVSVIDGATVVDTIPTTSPWAIAVDTVADRLWVASRDGNVSVFDSNDHSFIATIPVGLLPSDIAVNESLGRAYVANQASRTVSVIDGLTNTVVANLNLPAGVSPVTLVVNPTTNTVYIPHSPSLTKILDYGTNQFTVTSVSGLPITVNQMSADPVTGTVYAAGSGLVSIDGATDEIISLGDYGGQVTVDAAAGIIYTRGYGGLILLDRLTHSVLAKGHLPGSEFMAVNPSTGVLYALRMPSFDPSEIYVYDVDSDTDGLADVVDNCPDDANANQNDLDSDGTGDVCDPDVDGDGTANESDPDDDNDGAYDAEGMCGADEFDPSRQPERVDGVFDGTDEDGDGQIDEALPAGAEAYDCDGDGYAGTAEAHVYSYVPQTDGDQKTCQEYDLSHPNPNADIKPSLRWPADFNMASGVLDSFNRINILDVTTFMAPVRYLGTDVGTNPGDVRWDIVPGKGLFSTEINVQDLVALIAGPTGYPPMLGGARALGGPACPWPP